MKKYHIGLLLSFLFISTMLLFGSGSFFRENFNSLSNWKPLTFPKIKKHTKYSIINQKGNGILKAVSNASASGIIFKSSYNVFSYPIIKWKWKVSNIYKKGNAAKKSGDDYPVRIYVIFKYDPGSASLFDKAKYNAAKLIYGQYPPHSSLSYIWANKKHSLKMITSPYTDRAIMIPVQAGPSKVKGWTTERVNVVQDYRKAFGEKPPAAASIAIMNDSDNTKESATAYIDYIEVSKK